MPALTRALRVAGICALLLSPDTGMAETLTLTRDEAIATARQAYLAGDVSLTYAIASRIAASDPLDVEALLLLSASNEALGNPDGAFVLGKRAWAAAAALGRPDGLRYDIAQQTAHAAWTAGLTRSAAFWLKRARDLAPNLDRRARDDANLREIRSTIPLTFSGSLRISPTDNLNNGASSGHWTVGEAYIAEISGWAVAHPGVLTSIEGDATYDLGVSPSGLAHNSLGFGLSTTLHTLDRDEAMANPNLSERELDSWRAALKWTQQRLLDGQPPLGIMLEASQTWFGGVAYSPALRGEIMLPLTAEGDMTIEASLDRQWATVPITASGVHLDGHRGVTLPWGAGTLVYGVGATFVRSASVNSTFDSLDGSLILNPGLGGHSLSGHVGIGASWRHYDDYDLGIGLGSGTIHSTDGRTDHGLWLRAGLGFEQGKFAGLTPTVTVQRQMTWSNISKYQTAATSLYLGLAVDF